ncbi:hypothetical protein BpHYR1_001177 [Brachionus plicatilis]|uniref:Uncharacterized protein n=1 Tax=Brachionus plicatilis TaxID=10195 RepID=A0A3M7Q116_BRAPC|nr:hypothetical protein BpHYR1_001177 [Brachionus plicatilis]
MKDLSKSLLNAHSSISVIFLVLRNTNIGDLLISVFTYFVLKKNNQHKKQKFKAFAQIYNSIKILSHNYLIKLKFEAIDNR